MPLGERRIKIFKSDYTITHDSDTKQRKKVLKKYVL